MFGYIVPNEQELKIKDFATYKEFYCGLCRQLKKDFGIKGMITLSYDMTFLVLLLSALYEPKEFKSKGRCIVHPIIKQKRISNEIMEYASKMNVLLAYYKCEDDWKDEKKLKAIIFKTILKYKAKKIENQFPGKAKVIKEELNNLSKLESTSSTDYDMASTIFGRLLGNIFVYNEDDIFKEELYDIGFYLGKFIYVIDAYKDLDDDKKKNCFNPFINRDNDDKLKKEVIDNLRLYISYGTREFEKLPILKYRDILRNILYLGVWKVFNTNDNKSMEEKI